MERKMKSKDMKAIEMEKYDCERTAQIRDEAKHFAQSVSLIGITHATDKKRSRIRRYVWIMWLIIGVGLAFYQIQDRIVYYQSYPYNTEFRLQNDEELRFPQITICKVHWASKTKAKERGIDSSFLTLTELAKEMMDATNETFHRWQKRAKEVVDEFRNLTSDWESISKNISHTWQELVIEVFWNGIEKTDLVEDLATDVGHCFAIGTDERPLISTEAGLRSGLELHLDAKQSDSLYLMNYVHGVFTGFRILLHDPLEIPRMHEAGIVISPGTVSQLSVSFTNITHLGPPYYDCNTDAEYRMENCFADCENKFFLEECECRPFYYEIANDTDYGIDKKVCSFLEHIMCLEQYRNVRSEYDKECVCEQQCYTQSYVYSLSTSKISDAAIPFLKQKGLSTKNSSKESIPDTPDATIIYIYFPTLTYTSIVAVEAYTFLALLCDVGGALSLLLGATLLTVYEVGEFLVIVAADYFRFKPRPQGNISV